MTVDWRDEMEIHYVLGVTWPGRRKKFEEHDGKHSFEGGALSFVHLREITGLDATMLGKRIAALLQTGNIDCWAEYAENGERQLYYALSESGLTYWLVGENADGSAPELQRLESKYGPLFESP